MEKVSILQQIPYDGLQAQIDTSCSPEGLPYAGLLSSLTILQNHVVICDTGIGLFCDNYYNFFCEFIIYVVWSSHLILCVPQVGQRILKIDRGSGVASNIQFSNFGMLGLPYWLSSPLERVSAA